MRLARACRILRRLTAGGSLTDDAKDKAWNYFSHALALAEPFGVQEISSVVQEFDPLFGDGVVRSSSSARKCLTLLLTSESSVDKSLDAALQLARRIGDQPSIRRSQQKACLHHARRGDANALLAKLMERHKEDSLSKEELHEVLRKYLEKSAFDAHFPWKAFFSQLQEEQLPRMHKVYAVLERWSEAADVAETAREHRNAVNYLRFVPGTDAALRAVVQAERLGDQQTIRETSIRAGETHWQSGKYEHALSHFEKAGQFERASDCHYRLGQLARAIQLRPSRTPEWASAVRSETEAKVQAHLKLGQFSEAVQLLRAVRQSWESKREDASAQGEADRTLRLMTEVLKTARTALEAEVRSTQAQPGAEVYKRWSRLEEAAGNYLEAGLQAEMAQDFFTAALLFEKAGAFGQALSALGQTGQEVTPARKAELLERGGDFFMAGLLYERMRDIEKAVAMYEQAAEFGRAAELWRRHIGNDKSAFDDRYLELLTKAGQVERLAELCDTKSSDPSQSPEARVRLLRRIKQLGDQGLLEPHWPEKIAARLSQIESLDIAQFDELAGAWAEAAAREVLETYLGAFGMDLGTSNSVVALYNRKTGQPEVVQSGGRQMIPSVVVIDQTGREIVGIRESELMGKSLRAVFTRAKRAMGTETKFKAGDQLYRPEEISARIIGHGRRLAREFLIRKIGERISSLATKAMGKSPQEEWLTAFLEKYPPTIPLRQAVITVPAYFNEAQKQATRDAGKLAEINVLRLIHEPTAACLAQRTGKSKDETILIVDLGAGTLDLSLIQVGDGVFEVSEIEGDNTLGSSDLDQMLFAHFAGAIKREKSFDIAGQSLATRRLRQACEDLKIELSSQSSQTVELPHLINGQAIAITMTREEFERLAAPFLDRVRAVCRKIKTKPSRLILIGGGALMPAVRCCVKEVFALEPSPGLDPLTAVARGAAIQAAMMSGAEREALVLDATPFSLGIKSWNTPEKFKFDILIEKHSTTPTRKTQVYTTMRDNQSAVRIEVFQGESPNPEQNFKIGQFVLDGILPAKAGVPQVEVNFEIDANCLLVVTARDLGTGRQCQIKIADSHLLTPAQITSLQERLQSSRVHQERLERLEKITASLAVFLREGDGLQVAALRTRFRDRLQHYQAHMSQYVPTRQDNETMLEIYRRRDEWEAALRLALDRWDTIRKSIEGWLRRSSAVDLRTANGEKQLEELLSEGESVLRRTREATTAVKDVAETYRRWISVLEGLPINPEGNAEDLARHFLRLARYDEALTHFERFAAPLGHYQVELGLEIFARQRRRDQYAELLGRHAQLLKIHTPDFVRLNHSVRLYVSSVVWIQLDLGGASGSGSGFFIGRKQVATNRHVVTDEKTNGLVSPGAVRVVSNEGVIQVASISVPSENRDDVAVLQLATEPSSVAPLRLGFSELVEVGERIITIGFPSPGTGGFAENLFCNAGLVNRIRPSELCSERVLEVSIELQGGISGAPILNEMGEVVGLVTFTQIRQRAVEGGRMNVERSFFAIPVEVLRRLRAEAQP